jgi:hypothetical protein
VVQVAWCYLGLRYGYLYYRVFGPETKERKKGMMTPEGSPQNKKAQLERICFRCRQVNRRGSLCLLLLRDGSNCARRAFLQRHDPTALRPKLPTPARTDPNPLTLSVSVIRPTGSPAPNILTLRAQYGNPLSRWQGLFARLVQAATTCQGPVESQGRASAPLI